jgi:hypothetical protein
MPRATDPVIRRRRQRAQDYRTSVGWCCQDCGARHGTLTALDDNTYHRVEIAIVHLDGDRENWRWKNLRAVCGACRPRYAATFRTAPGHGGLDRSLPKEPPTLNGEP